MSNFSHCTGYIETADPAFLLLCIEQILPNLTSGQIKCLIEDLNWIQNQIEEKKLEFSLFNQEMDYFE